MSRRWLKKCARRRSHSPLRFIAKVFRRTPPAPRDAPNATTPEIPETRVDSLREQKPEARGSGPETCVPKAVTPMEIISAMLDKDFASETAGPRWNERPHGGAAAAARERGKATA